MHIRMAPYLSSLPDGAKDLVDLIGLPDMLRLVEVYGGCMVNLYSTDTSIDLMATTVGRENAEKLLRFYGVAPFTVPLCAGLRKAARNAEILAEFDRLTGKEGMSARVSIALISSRQIPKMHERTVWRILKTSPVVNTPTEGRAPPAVRPPNVNNADGVAAGRVYHVRHERQ